MLIILFAISPFPESAFKERAICTFFCFYICPIPFFLLPQDFVKTLLLLVLRFLFMNIQLLPQGIKCIIQTKLIMFNQKNTNWFVNTLLVLSKRKKVKPCTKMVFLFRGTNIRFHFTAITLGKYICIL